MKWVTATDLDHWADRIAARYTLSELVSNLIRASAKNIASFRFPTGDSAELPGYDGILEAEAVPPFVPGGLSVWEFGTSEDPKEKATNDFNTRSQSRPQKYELGKREATFVFVTPRIFREKQGWSLECRNKNIWRDVKVIDGVDLEEWLENCPAVALEFSQGNLDKYPPSGIISAEDFWSDYAGRTEPPLAEGVLIAGRKEQTQELLSLVVSDTQQAIVVRADSQDEALAFTIAAMRTAPQDVYKYINARTALVDHEEIARSLANRGRLIVGLRSLSKPLSNALVQSGNIVLVPLGNSAPNQRVTILLKRPPREEFADALSKMGLDKDKAERLARECGRSVTVLQRRIPAVAYQAPTWEKEAPMRDVLIPATLAGAWDSNSEEDRNIIAHLARIPYDDFERRLQPLLSIDAPPVERVGTIWTLVAPADSFWLLARHISRQDLKLLQKSFTTVFSELDPALDLSPEERPYASLQGRVMKHSSWLRDGLASTLLIIAVLGESAGLIVDGSVQSFVNQLVAELPGLGNDHRLIASLGAQLPFLMEAAPDPLVSTLESLLEGDGRAIVGIFSESSLLVPSSPHTNLLWALELLAWSPDYLSRVTLILAKLARIDPGGRLANRPINSLREIYLPWYPCTNAPTAMRLSIIDSLLRIESTIGWTLLIKLLPQAHDTTSPTSQPRWREFGLSEREPITRKLLHEHAHEIAQRVVKHADSDIQRLVTTIKSLSAFPSDIRKDAYRLLDSYADSAALPEDKLMMWMTLQDTIRHHTNFSSAEWALSKQDVTSLTKISKKLEPKDAFSKFSWLFDDYLPDLPNQEELSLGDIDKARIQAMSSILESDGTNGILRLAESAKVPTIVGSTTAEVVDHIEILDTLLDNALETRKLEPFVISLSGRAAQMLGKTWTDHVASRAKEERWTAQDISTLILWWPDDASTWKIAASFDPETENLYWSRKPARPLQNPREDIIYAINKYAEAGRAIDAIDALHSRVNDLPADLVFLLLDQALREIHLSPNKYQGHHWIDRVFEYLSDRDDIDMLELARREYTWLPLLDRRGKRLILHRLLGESPEFFVTILRDVYKARSAKEHPEPTEESRIRAEMGFRLLQSWKSLPGLKGNDEIDKEILREWILSARSIASQYDRADVADLHIGQMLAYSPLDPEDGAWPHRIVRDLIEELSAPKIEHGIMVEQFNKRGVYSKAIYEGGIQERELAEQARRWAAASSNWARTSKLLKDIAASWDHQAKEEDRRAEQDKIRFS